MMPPLAMPAHRVLPEPLLSFHPERQNDAHVHPLKGLLEFGPYSRSAMCQVLDPIRMAVICPSGMSSRVDSLLSELERPQTPRERTAYLIDYPGFSRLFGLRVVRAVEAANVELPKELEDDVLTAQRPHVVLAEAFSRAIMVVQAQRAAFDVLVILLPDRWEAGFEGGPGDDFDLHDYIKALTAMRGIPSQMLREGRALSYPCRASVMWRLSLALYSKAGGTPWRLSHSDPTVAHVGLGYALRGEGAGNGRFVVCCSQVFDADGTGPEFLTYDTGDARVVRRNPFLSRNEMRRVMARSLCLYQRRHGGRSPRKVVVHKTTRFTKDETEGCFDAWNGVENVDLIQVTQDCDWRGIIWDGPKPPKPSGYPCLRGTELFLSGLDVLLWTKGNVPSAVGGGNYYKEGKGIPSPLLLSRCAGHGHWEETCSQILGLTKMDWNNDSLYDSLPVTLKYAQTLARTLKRLPTLESREYQFRFFM